MNPFQNSYETQFRFSRYFFNYYLFLFKERHFREVSIIDFVVTDFDPNKSINEPLVKPLDDFDLGVSTMFFIIVMSNKYTFLLFTNKTVYILSSSASHIINKDTKCMLRLKVQFYKIGNLNTGIYARLLQIIRVTLKHIYTHKIF